MCADKIEEQMLKKKYARWMYEWETRLTTRDENRVVRPLEWGFEWIEPFLEAHGFGAAVPGLRSCATMPRPKRRWSASTSSSSATATISSATSAPRISAWKSGIRSSSPPTCARKRWRRTPRSSSRLPRAKIPPAQFLRFTSPERTPYPENDLVNARWYPAPAHKDPRRPKQAIIVMPQWNADALQPQLALHDLQPHGHFGAAALQALPRHSPAPPNWSAPITAVSANIGRTLSACRQAVVDIRCCLDWLEEQGYEHFGVLGTSLGSCYAFLASAHDPRMRVNAFNHASTAFGDVVWAGPKHAPREAGAGRGRADPGPRAGAVGRRQPLQLLPQNRQPRSRRTREEEC